MAITYPLTMPATPGFTKAVMRANSVVGINMSPFTGQQQVYQWPAEWWEADLELPVMSRAAAEEWISFLCSLRGMYGTFAFGDPGAKVARGVATGTPAVYGASQTGTSLNTQGWTSTTTGILLKGDYLQIAKNYLTFARAFDNALWVKNQCTATATNITNPLGGTDAERITPDGGATDAYIEQTPAILPTQIVGMTFTGGVWLKAATGTPSIYLRVVDNIGTTGATITLSTSWQRFNVSRTCPAAATTIKFVIGSGNSWPVADGAIDMWGAALYSPTLDARLHKNLEDSNSDSSLLATLSLWPRLRESPPDCSRLIVASPVGTFRLAENVTRWDVDVVKNVGLSFTIREAY